MRSTTENGVVRELNWESKSNCGRISWKSFFRRVSSSWLIVVVVPSMPLNNAVLFPHTFDSPPLDVV